MKASVIICTYNRAESLRTVLECLEWQTYDDFEVIVVNGPSTDATDNVLAEYGEKIKVLKNCEKIRGCPEFCVNGFPIEQETCPQTEWQIY